MYLLILLFLPIVYSTSQEEDYPTQTLPGPAFGLSCLSGYSDAYIQACSVACDCDWGYCKRCCKYDSKTKTCSSHAAIGWLVNDVCKTCSSGYTLDAIDSNVCNSDCGLFLDGPSETPKCCKAIPAGDGKVTCKKTTLKTCSSTAPTITSAPATPPIPDSYQFPTPAPATDQSACGDCYVHAAVGVLADRYNVRSSKPTYFSPQPYTSCGQEDGCGGGTPEDVFSWHIKLGITTCENSCTTGCHPFISGNGVNNPSPCPSSYTNYAPLAPASCLTQARCNSNGYCPSTCVNYNSGGCSYVSQTKAKSSMYIPCLNDNAPGLENGPSQICYGGAPSNPLKLSSGYSAVTYPGYAIIEDSSLNMVLYLRKNSILEYNLMREIYLNGPIASCYNLKDKFDAFFTNKPTGVYTQKEYDADKSTGGGHCVRTIGYGTTSSGVKYWLVANNWGPEWADNGFFKIQRGVNLATFESRGSAWINLPSKTKLSKWIAQTDNDSAVNSVAVENGISDNNFISPSDNDVEEYEDVTKEVHEKRYGGGCWHDSKNVTEVGVAIDFILRQPDEFDGVKSRSNSHILAGVSGVQKQVISNGHQMRLSFITESVSGEKFNHVNSIKFVRGQMRREWKPIVAAIISEKGSNVGDYKKNDNFGWDHHKGGWKYFNELVIKKYTYKEGTVTVEVVGPARLLSPVTLTSGAVFVLVISVGLITVVRRSRRTLADQVNSELLILPEQ